MNTVLLELEHTWDTVHDLCLDFVPTVRANMQKYNPKGRALQAKGLGPS